MQIMSWLFYESFHIIDGMITTFFILFLSLLVLVLLVLFPFFTKNILLLKHSFLSIANSHWSSIPIVANSVYASVGKCIVTNGVKSSFD